MPPDAALLEVASLSVQFGRGDAQRTVLRDINFRLSRGESIGVIGETGAGKSTIARAIVGLTSPASGSIHIGGKRVSAFSAGQWRELRKQGSVQYVFQDPSRSLDPDLTIGESIAEPLLIRGQHSRQAIEKTVFHQLERMKLDPGLRQRFPRELSGGQRQRVAIARALAPEPQLLILDEPVSALDSANRVMVLELLSGLRASGVAMLFISHDLGSVAAISDRIIVLYRGSIVEQGEAAAIVSRPSHSYTRLLVGSAPSVTGGAVSRERRAELRAELGG